MSDGLWNADEMRAEFTELRNQLSKDIADQLEAREARLLQDLDTRDQRLLQNLDSREQRLLQKLTAAMSEQLDTAVRHVDDRATVLVEDLRSVVIKAADGYAMSLDEINRKLDHLEHKWDRTIDDHSLAIKDHGKRIAALESE